MPRRRWDVVPTAARRNALGAAVAHRDSCRQLEFGSNPQFERRSNRWRLEPAVRWRRVRWPPVFEVIRLAGPALELLNFLDSMARSREVVPPWPPATSTIRRGPSTSTSAEFASCSGREISNSPRM